MITWHNRPELLYGPFGGGVLRHIPMDDATCADVQDHKHVQRAKSRRDGHEEVACEYGAGVVAPEGAPPLKRQTVRRSPTPWHVAPHRTRLTHRPSLRRSSAEIRSSPRVALARAMAAISCWTLSGSDESTFVVVPDNTRAPESSTGPETDPCSNTTWAVLLSNSIEPKTLAPSWLNRNRRPKP